MGYGHGSGFRSGLNPLTDRRQISEASRVEQAAIGQSFRSSSRNPALSAALEEIMEGNCAEVNNIIGEE